MPTPLRAQSRPKPPPDLAAECATTPHPPPDDGSLAAIDRLSAARHRTTPPAPSRLIAAQAGSQHHVLVRLGRRATPQHPVRKHQPAASKRTPESNLAGL